MNKFKEWIHLARVIWQMRCLLQNYKIWNKNLKRALQTFTETDQDPRKLISTLALIYYASVL